MAAVDEPLRYRRLRAPAEDQTALIEPPLAEIPALVARNQALANDWDRLSGVAFSAIRNAARDELRLWLEGSSSEPKKPFIAAGHQPTLYHPGVWLKNFLLSEIARQVGGEAINLTVDNDAIRSPSIRIPAGTLDAPRLEDISFDAPAEEMPWEERRIIERPIFDSFASRVQAAYAPLRAASAMPSQPLLIEHLWRHARLLANGSQMSLGNVLAYARIAVEETHGLKSADFDISLICRSVAWHEFLLVIFERAAEFQAVYNAALAEYRADLAPGIGARAGNAARQAAHRSVLAAEALARWRCIRWSRRRMLADW